MSTFFETFGSRNNFSTFEAFKNIGDLAKPIQQHLIKVYTTLAFLCLLTAAGSYAHITGLFLFGGGLLSFLIGLASLIVIAVLPDIPDNKNLRYGLLFNFAFMEGLSIGPLVDHAFHINSSGQLVLMATTFTTLIFGSFTLSSLLSNKRIFIYLGGILASAISMLFWMSFINAFMGSRLLFTAELYLGLFVFCGYVIYDTQLIIYRATYGSRDVVRHTLDLFIDLIGIFVRILYILIKNSEDKENRRRSSRRSNRRTQQYAGY
ncbi:inhibitor of apoptosis-promoting Bax1-domain-containing protein [Glomus cerebriforme]|uniref:Inhibitor of apoptosis-promoting Bax1-domain-containing protein n=1 Tax=Glomus cerebriforme TaxID=658196 RepID=A0A397TU73_9GLOM|nr:inhibitor of apoptosis-promoting Bax1-domain-containing protein [Glomus cerebriforme]